MESMSQLPEQQGELQEVWLNLPSNDSDLPSPGAASDNPFSPTASSPPVACSPSEALQLFSETYGKYVHGELALGMCIVGIITNVANLMVLTRRHMRGSPTNCILAAIAAANLLTSAVCVPVYVHFYLARDKTLPPLATRSLPWAAYLWLQGNFGILFHTASVWLTIQLALFRFLIIALPLRGPALFNARRAIIGIAAVFAVSAQLVVPNMFCYVPKRQRPHESDEASGDEQRNESDEVWSVELSPLVEAAPMLNNVNYWMQGVLIRLVPSALLTLFTFLLIREMKRVHQRRERLKSKGATATASAQRRLTKCSTNSGSAKAVMKRRDPNKTTRMLLAVVIVFLAVEMPQGLLTLLNALLDCFAISFYYPLGDLIDMLTLLQTSITFVLYTIMSRQFRDTFLNIFVYLPLSALHLHVKEDTSLFERSESCRSRRPGASASGAGTQLGQWDSERSRHATPRTPRAARTSTCSAKSRISTQYSVGTMSPLSHVSLSKQQSTGSGTRLIIGGLGNGSSSRDDHKPSAVALVLEERHLECDSQSQSTLQSQTQSNNVNGTTTSDSLIL